MLPLTKCHETHNDHNGRWECHQDGNEAEDCLKRDRHVGMPQSVSNAMDAKSILGMDELFRNQYLTVGAYHINLRRSNQTSRQTVQRFEDIEPRGENSGSDQDASVGNWRIPIIYHHFQVNMRNWNPSINLHIEALTVKDISISFSASIPFLGTRFLVPAWLFRPDVKPGLKLARSNESAALFCRTAYEAVQ